MKKIIKYLILRIIQIIEFFEYMNVDETEKITSSIKLPIGYKIKTDTGYKPISYIHHTKRFEVWKITTNSGKCLEGADEHIVLNPKFQEKYIKNLQIGDEILTIDGIEIITSIENNNSKVGMLDITVDDDNHRFYSNGILSHNSVMTAIIILHYICFNTEKSVMFTANKYDTVKEVIKKFKDIFKSIPYFLQPGVLANNEKSMTFDNDCILNATTTTANSGIGFTADFLFADEFAKIESNILTSFWAAVYPTLTSINNSKCILTSTPDGFNLFHDLYSDATKGLNMFTPMITRWNEVEGRDEIWKKKTMAAMKIDEYFFRREFDCEFSASSSLLLDEETIKRLENNKIEFTHQIIDSLEEIYENDEEFDYKGLIWDPNYYEDMFEDIEKKRFLLTVDLADGLEGDYSVINIFEIKLMTDDEISNVQMAKKETDFIKLKQIGLFRSNTQGKSEVAHITMEIVRLLGNESCIINFEVNQGGDYYLKCLEADEDFYDDIVVHTFHRLDASYEKPGVRITKTNKKPFCKEVRKLIRKDFVEIVESNSIDELSRFGLNKKGSFSSSTGHDDIAMTIVHIAPALMSSYFEDIADDVFSLYPKETLDRIYKILETSTESDYQDIKETTALVIGGTSTRY